MPTVLTGIRLGGFVTNLMPTPEGEATVSVKFKAVNPDDWPRLRGEQVIEGTCRTGEYLEEDIEFPQSALDIVCAGEGQLHLLPYTGNPVQP